MTRTATQALVFVPADERQISDVLSCLGDPDLTLTDIADRHGTTLNALVLWMSRPEIKERIRGIEHAFATVTRLRVADALPGIAQTLVEVVRDAQDELAHVPLNPKGVRHLEQRTRTRESARKACALLMRLARFTGGPAPERRERLPAPPSTGTTATALPEPAPEPAPAATDQPAWQPPRHPGQREDPDLDEVLAELRSMGFTIDHPRYKGDDPRQAGDEAPPEPPPASPPTSTPTPEGRCEAHPRVSSSPEPPPLDDSPRADTPPSHQPSASHPSHPAPDRKGTPREVVLTLDATSRPADSKRRNDRRERDHQPRRPNDHPRAPT